MKKSEINYYLKRYSYVKNGRKKGESTVSFYAGKRKEVINLDDDVIALYAIVDELIENEGNACVVYIMEEWIRKGERDIYIIAHIPMSRNLYYRCKRQILNKIFECCICRGLVGYNELLSEEIV